MFLEFQKITNSRPSQRSPIIVNSSAILKLDTDEFANHEGHGRYLATRVEVIGFPKYTFHTLTTMDDVLTHLFSVDVTSGLVPGNICAGGNTTGIVFPMTQYPFMKVAAIFNNTVTETDNYAFNPNYLIYTEEVFFNDTCKHTQSSAMMVVLQETSPLKIATKMSYETMFAVLQPTVVPCPPAPHL